MRAVGLRSVWTGRLTAIRDRGTIAAMRATLLVALATALPAVPAVARADRAVVVVNGEASAHARGVVASAVTAVLGDAGWKLPHRTDDDEPAIVDCFGRDRPWSCIAPLVHSKKIDRVVVVSVAPARNTADLVLTASLAVVDSDELSRSVEPCQGCNDALLDQAARALATTVVSHARRFARTTLAITTEPRGASVSVDAAPQGNGPITVVTTAGAHDVVVEQPGWVSKTLHVEAVAGKETAVDIALAAVAPPPPRGRPIWPLALVGVGLVAAATGTIISLDTQPPPKTQPQPKYLYNGPAIGVAIAGGLAAAVGVYFWLRPTSPHPVVTVAPGTAAIGWATAF